MPCLMVVPCFGLEQRAVEAQRGPAATSIYPHGSLTGFQTSTGADCCFPRHASVGAPWPAEGRHDSGAWAGRGRRRLAGHQSAARGLPERGDGATLWALAGLHQHSWTAYFPSRIPASQNPRFLVFPFSSLSFPGSGMGAPWTHGKEARQAGCFRVRRGPFQDFACPTSLAHHLGGPRTRSRSV